MMVPGPICVSMVLPMAGVDIVVLFVPLVTTSTIGIVVFLPIVLKCVPVSLAVPMCMKDVDLGRRYKVSLPLMTRRPTAPYVK